MRVADVMSKTIDWVKEDDTVDIISRIIFGRGINGVPVVNKKKQLVGFITERDILTHFYPTTDEYIQDPLGESNFEQMEDKISHIFGLKAKNVMSKNPVTVGPNTMLLKAQSLMFIHKIGRLPVTDKNSKLLGMITKGDIFKALVGNRLNLAEDEAYSDWLAKHYPFYVNWEKRLSFEIPELNALFKKYNIKGILDIGCGTGQHTLELLRKGYSVWGFERSRLMIRDARNKLKECKDLAKLNQSQVFFFGEFEKTLKTLKGDFQAAIFMGGSLAHNQNYKDVLNKTAKALPQKSVIVIQLPNFERILSEQKRLAYNDFIQHSGKTEHAFFEFYDKPVQNRILKTFSIFDFDGKAWSFYGLRSSSLAYITKKDIGLVLKKLGYSTSYYGSEYNPKEWGKLFAKPFDSRKSDWINIIATRK